MTVDDAEGGCKNCRFIDEVKCEWPLTENLNKEKSFTMINVEMIIVMP